MLFIVICLRRQSLLLVIEENSNLKSKNLKMNFVLTSHF
jgi:hypothetical protein